MQPAPLPAAAPPVLFDQYSRYASCGDWVRAALPEGGSVLDVGSGPYRLLGHFAPRCQVTCLDPLLAGSASEDALAGTLASLPSNERRFDLVVAVDTLEHVPPAERAGFLDAMLRLARVGVVLSGPWSEGGVAADVDRRIDAIYRAKTGRSYPWLEEHHDHGLPSLEEARARFEAAGLRCIDEGNGHAPWLCALLALTVGLLDRPEHRELVEELSRRFNGRLYAYDHFAPSYRRILVATRGALPAAPERLADEPASRRAAQAAWEEVQDFTIAQLARHADALVDRTGEVRRELADARRSTRRAREALAGERARADRAVRERDELEEELDRAARREAALQQQLAATHASLSWRLTAPLRAAARLVRRAPGRALEAVGRPLYRALPLDEEQRWRAKERFHRAFGWALRSTRFDREFQSARQFRPSARAAVAAAVQHFPPPAPGREDVFVFGVIDYHFRFQRPQQLARELARRGQRVFFVSPSFEAAPEPGFRALRVDEGLPLFSVKLRLPRPPVLYRGAPTGRAERQLEAALRELFLRALPGPSWSIVQHPGWLRLARLVPASRLVYDCMDHHSGFDGSGAELPQLEEELFRASDLVVVSSRKLEERARRSAGRVALIRNACEFEHFHARPADVLADPRGRRVIGYYGAIAEWFDVELVRRTARRFPECLVRLVGADTAGAKEALAGLANVELLGELPYEDLPRQLHAMDVCLVPFLVNELTLATNPVKVYEYLAAGRPVVATDLPELRDAGLDGLVHRAKGREEFLDKVALALAETPDDPQRAARVERARRETWQERALSLSRAVEGVADPLVSVVVVTWNNVELSERCLASVLADASWRSLELIVVDNASADGSPERLRELAERDSRVRVLQNAENRGFAAACNQGLALARGEYFVLLNNDTVVTEGWLRTMVSHFRRDPELGLLGPITNNIGNEARVPTCYAALEEMGAEARALVAARAGRVFPIAVTAFFCVMTTREVHEAVGALDERFGAGFFEDDDYCRRVRATGRKVACAEDVFVHHELSASFDRLDPAERRALFELNRRHFESKWGPWTPHAYRKLEAEGNARSGAPVA